MDMLTTFGLPVAYFVGFALALIYVTEGILVPWLRHRRERRDAQGFTKSECGHLSQRYPASGGSV